MNKPARIVLLVILVLCSFPPSLSAQSDVETLGLGDSVTLDV